MRANATKLFDVRPEEVTDSRIEIVGEPSVQLTTITCPAGYTWADFDGGIFFEILTTTNGNTNAVFQDLSGILAGNTTTINVRIATSSGTDIVSITGTSDTTASVTYTETIAGLNTVGHMYGYKRRYSKTSLAEITEAASKPNLLNNTWHASPKVRNQRGFDGDWASLAVGVYGLDGWLKTDSTHKGFIVAAGSYKPSTKHIVIAEDGGILAEVMSPADGGNWSHSFPFAADKFVLRESDIPLGWSPDSDSRLDELNKEFIRDVNPTRNVPVNHVSGFGRWGIKVPKMRKTPTATIAVVGTYTNASAGTVDIVSDAGYRLSCTVTNTANPGWWYGMTIDLDATIALSEVTNDAEHRVVWGA